MGSECWAWEYKESLVDEMPVSKGEKVGDKIQFLINVIGLVIIDIGAFAYMEIYDEGKIFALIILMFGTVLVDVYTNIVKIIGGNSY